MTKLTTSDASKAESWKVRIVLALTATAHLLHANTQPVRTVFNGDLWPWTFFWTPIDCDFASSQKIQRRAIGTGRGETDN